MTSQSGLHLLLAQQVEELHSTLGSGRDWHECWEWGSERKQEAIVGPAQWAW